MARLLELLAVESKRGATFAERARELLTKQLGAWARGEAGALALPDGIQRLLR